MSYIQNQKQLDYLINDSLYFKYLFNPRTLFLNWQIYNNEKYKFHISSKEEYIKLLEDAYIEFSLFKSNVTYNKEFIDNIEHIFQLYKDSEIETCIGSDSLWRKMTKEADILHKLEDDISNYKPCFKYTNFNSFKESFICNLKYSEIKWSLDYASLRAYCSLINTDTASLDYAFASVFSFLGFTHFFNTDKNIIDYIYIENNNKEINLVFDIKGESLNAPYINENFESIFNKFKSTIKERLTPVCEYNIVNYNYGNKYILPIVNNIDYPEGLTDEDQYTLLKSFSETPLDKVSHIFSFYKS